MKDINRLLSNLGCGQIEFKPYVVMENGDIIYPEYKCNFNEKYSTLSLVSKNEKNFIDSLYFESEDSEIICKRTFENISGGILGIKEVGFTLSGIDFGENREDDYFYHNENPRTYMQMTFSIDHHPDSADAKSSDFDMLAGNNWYDDGMIHSRSGCSPHQPFPAILFSNYNTDLGLVHGSLSQKVFYHNYSFYHTENGIEVNVYSSFKAISHMDMEDGKVLSDEWYLGKTDNAGDIEKIFERFIKELRKHLGANYKNSFVNRNEVVWDTWNDGIFRNISEDMLVREAAFIKENLPTVRWIELDDGYAVFDKHSHGIGVPYEGEEGIDKNKFPGGLRQYSDKIRQLGLRPAIWIGGFCSDETKIYKEHPEWFVDYSYRIGDRAPLDVSIKEVRAYMKDALHILCEKYGFDGIKHDFWSYAFEDTVPILKNKDKSGYEHREWWMKELKNVLPENGYLQSCCDIAMGNPFLGKYFTNYRYGIDIGTGNWEHVKTNFLWGTACFALHMGDVFIPNSDSIGMFPGLNDDEAELCVNYCIVTHSLVEISGILTKAENNKRYKMLRKAICNPNNGQDVYFIGYDYRNRKCYAPQIMYFNTPHFSSIEKNPVLPLKTVGLFNVFEEDITLSFSKEELGLEDGEYVVTDVWTGEQYDMDSSTEFLLKPHTSRLLAVSKKDGIQLLDANVRIVNAVKKENMVILETDYALKETELLFNKKVKKITFNDAPVVFDCVGNAVKFDTECKGIVKAEF